jgi:hypothetical protein
LSGPVWSDSFINDREIFTPHCNDRSRALLQSCRQGDVPLKTIHGSANCPMALNQECSHLPAIPSRRLFNKHSPSLASHRLEAVKKNATIFTRHVLVLGGGRFCDPRPRSLSWLQDKVAFPELRLRSHVAMLSRPPGAIISLGPPPSLLNRRRPDCPVGFRLHPDASVLRFPLSPADLWQKC